MIKCLTISYQPCSGVKEMESIHVLIVDDKPEFIDAIARFLANEFQIEIIGLARSGGEALAQAAALKPDLILMDYIMPKMDGIEATQQIKAYPNAPCIVILTAYDNPEYRIQAEKVGADGLVAKMNLGNELLPLIYRLFPQLGAEELVLRDPTLEYGVEGDK